MSFYLELNAKKHIGNYCFVLNVVQVNISCAPITLKNPVFQMLLIINFSRSLVLLYFQPSVFCFKFFYAFILYFILCILSLSLRVLFHIFYFPVYQ